MMELELPRVEDLIDTLKMATTEARKTGKSQFICVDQADHKRKGFWWSDKLIKEDGLYIGLSVDDSNQVFADIITAEELKRVLAAD